MGTSMQSSQSHPKTIKLWPPSPSIRIMLVERITKNLMTPSIFSMKYGLLSAVEAEQDARQIEEMAFAFAGAYYEKEPDGDGSSAVQLYAKESSKNMVEVLKRGPRMINNGAAMIPEEVGGTADMTFDISGGRRALIYAEEAVDLFRPLTVPGNAYQKVCFSNKSFGVDAANVVGPILFSLKSRLREVDLSDFVAGRPEAEALEVMNIFSKALEGCDLRYLNLSDNALEEKGIRAFGSLLGSQENLEELYLMNDGISEEAARAVNELIPCTGKLRILHFHNNMTGDEGARAISEIVRRSPLLEDFRCSSTRIGSKGGVALAESLVDCTSLRRLDLCDNMFGVDAGLHLSKTLYMLTNLTEVNLSYLNLEDEAAKAVAIALEKSAASLEILELAGNDITVKAASSLGSCVASKELLTKLNLAENKLGDEGTVLVAKALEDGPDQLIELDLSSNSMRRVGARVLAHAVAKKPALKLLNINGNYVSEEGIDEVREILKSSVHVLGPLDENDPDGEDTDEDVQETMVDEYGLELKLKALEIN
ncbi:RAN GTPase-activating protein 1-like protein [Drosera capensis]